MEKIKPSFLLILAQTISEQIILLLFALVSGGFGLSQSYGRSIEMFETIPVLIWYIIFVVLIIFLFSRAILVYRKELESYNSQSQSLGDKKITKISTSEFGDGNAFSAEQVHAPIIQQRDVIDSHDTYNFGYSDMPNKDALKYKIHVEVRKFYREFKAFLYMNGHDKSKQFSIALDIVKEIWKDLLPQAEWVLKDTLIPNLIDEIYTQITKFRVNWDSLQGEYQAKNEWLAVVKSTHPDVVVINKKIADLETELDQLWNNIEAKTNQLIELTNN